MRSMSVPSLFTILICIFSTQFLAAAVIQVPADYATIQAAIDAASNGDEIIVSEGIYGQVRFKGKNLNIHSTDPMDINVVKNTIIRPSLTPSKNGGSVVIFEGNEIETCRLAGFMVTGGFSAIYPGEPGQNGSGIRGHGCKALIENNFIFDNVATNPTLTPGPGSSRWKGGGINDCDGIVQNNIIDSNFANQGAGLYGCDGIILNNVITRNIATSISSSNPNFVILPVGGGLDFCNGIIINNTIVNNRLTGSNPWIIGGLRDCQGTITNNIVWHSSELFEVVEYDNSSSPTYCIIKHWSHGGEGNINSDPLLTKIVYELNVIPDQLTDQNYRLHPDSPAIDSGKSTTTLATDIAGAPRGFNWPTKSGGDGSNWDIGAYELTTTSLNLWIPNRPLEIENGANVDFHWLAYADAGDTIQLSLYQDDTLITDLGPFTTPMPGLIHTSTVILPDNLPLQSGYTLLATSAQNNQLTARTHPFAIIPRDTLADPLWLQLTE